MKKEIADKWVEALRFGKYKQGRTLLHDYNNNSFCCLGVLCDLGYASPHNSGAEYIENDPDLAKMCYLKTKDGEIDILETTLAKENDNGKSFEEIANIIEKYYEEL